MDYKIIKEIILIAGLDYPKVEVDVPYSKNLTNNEKAWIIAGPDPLPFQSYCRQWAENTLKRDKRIKVTFFDFYRGVRAEITLDKQGKIHVDNKEDYGKPNWNNYRLFQIDQEDNEKAFLIPYSLVKDRIISKLKPPLFYLPGSSQLGDEEVTAEYYFNEYFENLKPNKVSAIKDEKCISITSVYKYILEMGKNNLNQKNKSLITEMHFFCHSFPEGPILINTTDFITYMKKSRSQFGLVGKRNPMDYDGRAQFDFLDGNLDKNIYRKAFDNSCTAFVWGCNRDDSVKNLILETIRLSAITDKFKFLYTEKIWGQSKDAKDFYRIYLTNNGKAKEFTVDTVVNLMYTEFINLNYVQRMSIFFNCKTIGPVLGTYSTNDEIGNPKTKFMHVVVSPNEKLPAILNFYRKNGIIQGVDTAHGRTSANSGRGYGIYFPY